MDGASSVTATFFRPLSYQRLANMPFGENGLAGTNSTGC
jgi:hypothetical protein